MLRKLACIAAVGSALWLSVAAGLGLGEIDVRSRLNQGFSAVIPLAEISADEAESLLVSLASNDDFRKAGVERSEYVTTLEFNVRSDGQPRIEITSKQLAREPYISFLIDVRGPRNRLLREYTVLLDPPQASVAKPAAPTPAAGSQFYETPDETQRPARPAPAPAIAQPATPPAAPAAAPEEATAPAPAAGSYGPVQTRETLWSIAARLRADPGISMDQVMLALFTANPKAFEGGINGLRKGSVLRVPSADEQRAVGAAEAKAKVAQLRGLSASPAPARSAPPPAAAVPPAVTAPPPPVAKPAPAPAPPPAPTPATPPRATPSVSAPAAPAPAPEPAPTAPAPAAVETPATPPPAVETPPAPAEAPPPVETTPEPAESSTPPIPVVPAEEPAADAGEGLPLLPILAVLLLLAAAGGGYWYYRKRQQQEDVEPAAASAHLDDDSGEPAPLVVATAGGSQRSVMDELEQLESSLGAEEPLDLGAPATPKAPSLDSTLSMTAQIPVKSGAMTDPTATAVLEPSAASTARLTEKVDFDVTGQFESDTVSINLDTNDPVAEADFHLAYGLYDEAALLLMQAAEKEPGNTTVRVKLAEVYFAAGKAPEFQQTAEALKADLPASEWQKLAILGQQLCPDAAIFRDVGSADLSDAVDLNFDEPASPEPMSLDLPEATMTPAAAEGGGGGNVLDFKLEDFQLPSPPAAAEPAAARTATGNNGGLEFSLSVPEIKVEPAVDTGLELDLASFDLDPAAAPAPAKSAPAAAMPRAADLDMGGELRLEDIDVAADSENLADSDAAGTKLDLARAYMDMDKDMARTLLEEVIQQGNDEQKSEAQALMSRVA